MRYLSFLDAANRPRVGAADAADVRDLTDFLPPGDTSPMRRLITAAATSDFGALLARAPVVAGADVRPLPVVPDPSKIVAAPVNYRAHQAEMNEAAHIDSLGVFLKAPSSVLGDGGTVRLPYDDRRFDQEGEFAAVIGRVSRNLTEAEALDAVFGYTCLLDMTMRGGEDRSVRKSFDTFTPIGPTIVTPDELPPIDELQIHLWVNGVLRQRADLSDLLWGLPRLIAYASSVMTLLPGDIITTGTPEGVGEVFDGDRIDLEVTGIGRLTAQVSTAGATPCPTRGARSGPVPPKTLSRVAERTSAPANP
ncbi:2-keto-4-pentenoate hydratase/2-oxohepta-3-ene-1,7-dioic acid hydratase (catechol pathway) [Lentzea xinjiangensis]|uniref:2-keto-4-pentenoate hydratase/2-oxohepta-3-ene-1,7-dioic acid hydratase (Catechol pathway) n=1 Tax=Lentzea xinjiangensis TaxID=402600 RepID=A0A1H9NIB3_9PSEU|nr:fumarylacetoacetate hydrolase family protein [Lentzea xinjiangensis]SER35676.1 2-keto-4-pentenoate hydratase/2-oxohepta-3-ene-1,7-dioic acid hydratase (catechol pathway) [Lentzea xinjiangensis]